jgi:uncharacterized protein involved in exopolysaccharide biosynthesis
MAHTPVVETDDGAGIISKIPLILWERRWLIIIPMILAGIAGTVAAFVVPPVYVSRALLLVDSDDIDNMQVNGRPDQDGDLIDKRMAKIRQQILSRPDLIELIQARGLAGGGQTLEELLDKIRTGTSIDTIDSTIGAPTKTVNPYKRPTSIAFSLSVRYDRPGQAQAIAQSFVDRLLKLDATATQTEAANTVRYLEEQEATLQTQLTTVEDQSKRIAASNGMALTSRGASTINIGSNYEAQIAQLQQSNATLKASIGDGSVDRDPAVVQAQAALAAAKAQFSDDHPDVKLAQTRLAAARNLAAQQNGKNTLVEQQIAYNNTAIAQLDRARKDQLSQASSMSAAQSREPLLTQQISQLASQADTVRANLAKTQALLLSAQAQAKLADEQRGMRLTLIDPPVAAKNPASPNRPVFIAGGFAAGAGLGLVLSLLLEAFLRPIRTVGALTRVVGEPPLAVVPVLSKRKFKPRWKLFGKRRDGAMAR